MENKLKILIVEDEERIAYFMNSVFTANGYDTITVKNGSEARSLISSHCPDLVILDLGLPDMDGIEIIRFVRTWSNVPIIVVSARAHERDKVEALDAGADDYVTKPFGTNELLARVRTSLRHVTSANSSNLALNGRFEAQGLVIDFSARRVFLNGTAIHVTNNEYKILSVLALNAGKVLTYDYLLKELWGPAAFGNNQALRVHMANIRHKIEKDPADPQYILTELGVGYRMIEGD